MKTKYLTFINGELVTDTSYIKSYLKQNKSVIFVNVKETKLTNNIFNTYRKAQEFADSLTYKTIYINIKPAKVLNTQDIDF